MLTIGLRILSVAVKHDTSNLVLHFGAQTANRGGHDGCALAVATADNDAVGTLAVGQVEEALGLAVGGGAGACVQSALSGL